MLPWSVGIHRLNEAKTIPGKEILAQKQTGKSRLRVCVNDKVIGDFHRQISLKFKRFGYICI